MLPDLTLGSNQEGMQQSRGGLNLRERWASIRILHHLHPDASAIVQPSVTKSIKFHLTYPPDICLPLIALPTPITLSQCLNALHSV